MLRRIHILISFFVLCLTVISCSPDSTTVSSGENKPIPVINYAEAFQLQEGDLLFQDSDCGPFCDAIEKVTHGISGKDFSHVGMVIKNDRKQLVVIEAITKGVVETPIDSFLIRSFNEQGKPKVLVGRLKEKYQSLVHSAVENASMRLGKSYDDIFDINNDQYYCSELIYFAFKEANDGTPIFQLRPMTYNDPDTKTVFPIWQEYFDKLGKPIPENQPGLNPGSMSRSVYLDIVFDYVQN